MTNEQLIFHIYGSHCEKYIYIYICGTWGPFNNHNGSILLLSSPFTNINLHVKIQSIIFVHVWEVLEDHFLNPRYQSVSELRPHHNGDICTTRKITSSSYMGHDVKNNNNFGYLGGPGNAWRRTSIIGLGLSLCTSIISFKLIYMSNMEAI